MSNLPEKLTFEPFCFMRLANGGHQQEYKNHEHGIHVKKIKQNRDAPWTLEITYKGLPGQIFNSIEDLRKALNGKNTVSNP